jgi:peptide/nickel transport system permease protein
MVRNRLTNTVLLAAFAAIVSIPLAIGLGLLCAIFANGWFDRASSAATLFLISVPEFLIGAVLVLLFAVHWRLFPAIILGTTFDGVGDLLRSAVLPTVTLTCTMLAHMARMTRAAVVEVLRQPYIEMAMLKGLPRRRIILRHALLNALGPIASVVALNLGYLVSGVVVVEAVFNYPGMGRLMVDAVASRDVPMIQATILLFCCAYIFFNLLADALALVSNPRLRHRQ